MPHECQIYVLFDESGVVNYVGRTARPIEKRMGEHQQLLGFRPKFLVIDRCSTDCRNVEKKWIEYYRERGFKLRNVNYGQGPHFLPESSRKQLSQTLKGRPVTWGDKISGAQKGQKRNWSAEGRKRVEATQFKPGVANWDSLTPEQQAQIKQSARANWNDPDRAARMSKGLHLGSADRTPEERVRIGKKISESHLKRSPEERSQLASAGAQALLAKDPNHMSRNIKRFWEELRKDPEAYADYIKRRADAIRAGKANKE